eukprot:5283632-Ditylum_brightwellii.AAC.1
MQANRKGGDKVVIVKIIRKMAELLTKIDPKLYQKHVHMEEGQSVLYMEPQKQLYGTLIAAL